jgi:NAD(P)-dependent dehydrogenase (short-subunit alcohol dehydrogenase family)
MVQKLAGHVALVTGGGGEIGRAIACTLADAGASVVASDMDLEKADETARQIRQAGGKAESLGGNIADPDTSIKAVNLAVTSFDKLTILVNTAATVTEDGRAEDISFEDWNRTLSVNLTGVFLACKYAMPAMRKAGDGRVVNITSQLGQIGVPLRSPYTTTKAALMQFTRCLAVDYAEFNIRANSLSPGGIDTERRMRRFSNREEARAARGPMYLLGRLGTVQEVAKAALFLVSDDASFVTGTDLLCDGGYLAFKGRTTDTSD